MHNTTQFSKNLPARQITITSLFNATKEKVWDAFTNPEITDQWWAPQPFKAVTTKMNFVPGGQWLYYMLSPEGEKHYCMAEFLSIRPYDNYEVIDAFCDENGKLNTEFPRTKWQTTFTEDKGITTVTNVLTFDKEEDITMIIEMGFEEGYKMGLDQLRELLKNS
jgi:uncharacterized protein YndB with AHSA1/START domain